MAEPSNTDPNQDPNADTKVAVTKEDLEGILKPFAEGMTSLNSRMEKVQSDMANPPTADPGPDPKDPDKDMANVDLEAMSRKDFLDVIVDEVSKKVNTDTKPTADKVDNIEEKALRKDLTVQIEKCKADHADFELLKKEIGAEVTKNPFLSPEDARTLARIHNPEKTKEVDEQLTKDAEEAAKHKSEADLKAEAEKATDAPNFGGLTPTSGKTVPVDTMKSDEAAQAAYSKVFGGGQAK